MRILHIAALTLLASAPAFAAEGHFDRTLHVGSGLNLTIQTGSGYIHVTPGNDGQIHIAGHIHANAGWLSFGSSDVDSRIHQIESNPPIQQSGNSVNVGETMHNSLFHDISIDYEIQAPRGSVVHAGSGSGDVQVEDPGNSSDFSTGSGSIRVNNLHGAASFKTGSGDIQLQQVNSGDVKAETGSGSIRINGLSGGLRARSGSGDIQVEGHITADWHADTGSGSVRLGIGQGAHATIEASTGSGEVRISQPLTMQGSIEHHHVHENINGGGPTIQCTTGSGDVDIH